MKHSRYTPLEALSLKAGIDLDVFVYEYIFDSDAEKISPGMGKQAQFMVPSFSRRPDGVKPILIKMFAENEGMTITVGFGLQYQAPAVKGGFVKGDSDFPVWGVFANVSPNFSIASFGRLYEEALCKLAVQLKMRQDAQSAQQV